MKKQLFLFLIALINVQFGLFAQNNYSPEYLVPYRKGDLWGYSDTLKKIIIEPKFEKAGFFYESKGQFFADGLKDGRNVLIFSDGNYVKNDAENDSFEDVIEINNDSYYTEKINQTLSVNGKHGFKLVGNNIEYPPVYKELVKLIDYSSFPICAIFKLASNNLQGMVDTLGNILIPFEYSGLELYNSNEKVFKAYNVNNGYYGLIDWKNNILYPFKLLAIARFTSEKYLANVADLSLNTSFYGILDHKGKTVLPFKYMSMSPDYYYKGGITYYKVSLKNYREFYVNLKGVEYYEE